MLISLIIQRLREGDAYIHIPVHCLSERSTGMEYNDKNIGTLGEYIFIYMRQTVIKFSCME